MANIVQSSSIVIPLDDNVVRFQLRELEQPMCFFGEKPLERRERLRKLLMKLKPEHRIRLQQKSKSLNREQLLIAIKQSDNKDEQQVAESSYTEGSELLKLARCHIANYSIERCSERLDMARLKQLESLTTRLIPKQDLIEGVRQIEDLGSYVDEDNSTTELKTLTSLSLNPTSTLMATSCRSGKCKLWSIPDMETHSSLKGHSTNANFIIFNPKSGSDITPNGANLASCAMDGSISLWNLIDDNCVSQLCQQQSNYRTTRIRYHPSGNYLASCCSDKSWRLWDLTNEQEILQQDGHSEAVFDLAFHHDGSLVGSASLDCFARIWDLRIGKSILLLEGHTGGLRTIDFSPDGYHIATGSLDHSVKIWDLRQKKLEYTIPAHLNAVTSVMFEKTHGYCLITSSFDKTIKFWSNQTWAPIKTLDAYDDKITNFDISCDNKYLASCYFKYIKLWSISDSIGNNNDNSNNGFIY